MPFIRLLKRAGSLILVPVVISMIVFSLLALSYLLPTEGMKEHTKAAFPIFDKEGYYYPQDGPKGTVRDNFIDAMYMNQAIVGAGDADLFGCVMSAYDWCYKDRSAQLENLEMAVKDPGSVTLAVTEDRFFNGHVIFVKLLLLLFDYNGIRVFNLTLIGLLTALLCWLMYRRGLGKYIPAVLVSIWFLRPVTVGLNMAFTGIYLCAVIPCIWMLAVRKETLEKYAWLFFVSAGSVMFCFNMNYFQLIGFGMMFLLVLLITGLPEKPGVLFRKLADLFIAWMIGYAGTMLIKWTLYQIFVDPTMFEAMIRHFLGRSDVDRSSRLGAVWFNTKIAFGSIWFLIPEALFLAGALWHRKKAGLKLFSFTPSEILLLAAMLLLPVARMAILANHSYVHAWFVYRVLMLPVLASNLWITGWITRGAGAGGTCVSSQSA